MITRRSFLKYIPSLPVLVALPAAIIGNKLGRDSLAAELTKPNSAKPISVRVHAIEVDELGNLIKNGRVMEWTTYALGLWENSVGAVRSVSFGQGGGPGNVLGLLRPHDTKLENFQVRVTRLDYLSEEIK